MALCLVLALACASAQAAPFVYQRAQSEALSKNVPGEAFTEPFGITIDGAGNLYVGDPRGNAGTGVIDKFDDEGNFLTQIGASTFTNQFLRGIAVNDETGHIYAGETFGSGINGALYVFSSTGTELSRWTGANTPEPHSFGEHFVQVAVDNSSSVSHGDVYTQSAPDQINVFESQNGDLEEGKFLRRLEGPSGFEFNGHEGIAVDRATGQVYVADQGHNTIDRFAPDGSFETALPLPLIKGQAGTIVYAVAVDARDGHIFAVTHAFSSAVVELDPSGQVIREIDGIEGNPFGELGGVAVAESGPHAGAVYVTDPGKAVVDVFAEEQPSAPTVDAAGIKEVSESSATFLGEINPHGLATTYHFEYGPCSSPTSCAGAPYPSSVPSPDATLPSEDFSSVPTASFSVGGLTPATTYHFRLSAENAEGPAGGQERVFTTLGGEAAIPLLPDGREWELVSPPDKGAGQLSGTSEVGGPQAAVAGDAVTYYSNAATEGGAAGAAGVIQVLSTRTPAGWTSRDLATPHSRATGEKQGSAPTYTYFDEALSAAVAQPQGLFEPSISVQASEQTPYLQQLGACASACFTPLVTAKQGFANVPEDSKFGEEAPCEENGLGEFAATVCGPLFQSATPDLSHIVFRSGTSLVPGAPTGGTGPLGARSSYGSLYEWAAGQISLVSVLPPNEAGNEVAAPVVGTESQPVLGAHFGTNHTATARNAISQDGARVFWESEESLYMRDTVLGRSLQIDAPSPDCPEAECPTAGRGRFQIASADGSQVFFTDSRRLTRDSGAQGDEPDLYECRVTVEPGGELACALSDLTPAEGGESAAVQGDVLGASEDGSAIYFMADGTLGGLAPARGNCRNANNFIGQLPGSACNLFTVRDGEPPQYIASLSGEDVLDWREGDEVAPVRVSPNGHWLSFLSERPLTGYDSTDALSGRPDAELFLFHDTGALQCVSCLPNGARPRGVEYAPISTGESTALPAGAAGWRFQSWVAALPPRRASFGLLQPGRQPAYLSDSGRLFFNALDALVPQDVNGVGDVYQYEPPGVGGCTTDRATFSSSQDGCIDLISSGTSPEVSAFLDASENGDDVFFLTGSRLVPGLDLDSQKDVYDAHACTTGAPCLPEPASSPPPCSGEACRNVSQGFAEGKPASAEFSGPGNQKPSRKRHHHKKHPHKKHHRAKKGKHAKRSHANRGAKGGSR